MSAPDDPPARLLPFSLPHWLPWSLVAVLMLVAGWLGQLWLGEHAATVRLRDDAALAAFEFRTARNQLEAGALLSRREQADHRAQLAARATQLAAVARQLQAANDLAPLRIFLLAPPAGSPSSARAALIWNPVSQTGVLHIEALAAPDADHVYQLWIASDHDGQPADVDAGPIVVDAASRATRVAFHPGQPVATAIGCSLRLAPRGDTARPDGPVVLRSE